MRDPNRLDNFYDVMKKYHKEYMPDIRFGQLMSNFFGWLYSVYKVDCFFPEEDKMIEWFKEYCEKEGMWRN